jgi:dinuclear metal center YbgI/SA1388 family protein
MASRDKIISYINELFQEVDMPDYSHNGLQFEGKKTVKKIVSGVDANMDFYKKAIEKKADLAVVHHGIFWKGGEWRKIDRFAQETVKILMKGNLNLFALHLPLDAHPELGNNAVIAKELGAEIISPFGRKIGFLAKLPKPMKIAAFKKKVAKVIGPVVTHLDFGKPTVQTIGIVSGGGWNSFTDPRVYAGDVDVILTGEVIHQGYSSIKDRKIHLISAGHYATEVFGARALGEHLAKKFKLEHEFIDLPTGL